jgi:HSP20 family protein
MSEQALSTSENSTQQVQDVQQVSPEANRSERPRPVFRPLVDLVDTADAVILWANLPGVDENTVDITLEKNVLTLKATVEPPRFEGMKPLRREFAVGDYERTFAISDEIDRDAIEATVTQGVLKLTLPKSQKAALRKVAVKAG